MSKIFKFNDVKVDSLNYFYNAVGSSANGFDAGPPVLVDCETAAVESASRESMEIIEQARNEARKIIASAHQISRKIRTFAIEKVKDELEEARKAGYENGLLLARQDIKKENQHIVDELVGLMRSIDEEKANLFQEYEEPIKDLSFRIAKKIIDEGLKTDEKLFLSLYKKAVHDFMGQKWIKISVSECDAEFVTANAPLLLSMVKGAKNIEVATLKDAPRGTCVVETTEGIADTSVNTQISRLTGAFTEADMSEQ